MSARVLKNERHAAQYIAEQLSGIGAGIKKDIYTHRADEGYAYIQVSMSVADPAVEEREYRPFRNVRDNWPQYLLTLDPLPLERDGVTHLNMLNLMVGDEELAFGCALPAIGRARDFHP